MRCSSFPFEHLADLPVSGSGVLRLGRHLQDIGEHLDQVLGGRTFPFPQSLQLFFGPASELTHAFREHLENLIPGRHLGLGDEKDQQCETFGSSNVPEISGVQRVSLLCQVLHFRVPQAFHQGLHVAQRLQPGKTAEPLIQVGQGRALGRLLDAVEGGEGFCAFSANESQEGLLLCFGESVSHALIDVPIHQVADAPGHALQGTEAWQLAVLFHQDFNRRADEIRRILHHLSRLVHSLRRDMPDVFPFTLDLQVLSDGRVIAVERVIGCNVRDQVCR
jgi:hypothetical protein